MVNEIAFFAVAALFTVDRQAPLPLGRESSFQTTGQGQVTLRISPLRIRNDRWDLLYEVCNDSEREIWLCDDVDTESPVDFETVASLDGSTLSIRLRLGIPLGWWRFQPTNGRYVRLAARQRYTSVLWFALPVRQQPVFSSRSAHHPEEQRQANRLVLEVGYFPGDLSMKVQTLIRDANEVTDQWRTADEQFFKREDALEAQRLGLSKRMKSVADETEKERLKREYDELEAQLERLTDVFMLRNRASLYIESLGMEIPVELFEMLRDVPPLKDSRDDLVIPYEYAQEVEKEHFVRATLEKVTLPYLPPRYFESTQKAPWGKRPVTGSELNRGNRGQSRIMDQ